MNEKEKANNYAAEIIMKACEEQTNALLYNLRPDIGTISEKTHSSPWFAHMMT